MVVKRTLIILTDEQYQCLLAVAKRRGNALAAEVRRAVEEYLRREEKEAPKS